MEPSLNVSYIRSISHLAPLQILLISLCAEQPDKDICEDSGSDADDHAQFETDEGLSLLWNQRHEDLDHALKQRKQQDVYTQTWYHCLSCYVCCQPSVISS